MAPFAPPSKRSRPRLETPRINVRGVFLLLLPLLLSLFSTSALAEYPSPGCSLDDLKTTAPRQQVRVGQVVDGDTVRLADGRKVRLIGVNTPEMPPQAVPEPFALEARRRLEAMIGGEPVLLVTGPEPKDDYGRTLAHLFDSGGNSIEAQLVAGGLGWHVAFPPNLGLADCLETVEHAARRRGAGVWSLPPSAASDVGRGGFQRIRGEVVKVSFGRDWWISFGDRLVARVRARDQHFFQRSEIAALAGKTVELEGWVYPSRSRKYEPWRIDLRTPHGIAAP